MNAFVARLLAAYDADPSLQGVMQQLQKTKTEDKLKTLLNRRSTKEQLQQRNILQGTVHIALVTFVPSCHFTAPYLHPARR